MFDEKSIADERTMKTSRFHEDDNYDEEKRAQKYQLASLSFILLL